MFSIIPILIIYLIPIILSGKTVLTKKNLKDLLIYYKDNGYLNPFGWFYCTNRFNYWYYFA
jgi:hypothetical protein